MSVTRRLPLFAGFAVSLLAASPVLADFDAPVSVWDSSVLFSTGPTVVPIGGSGQINGGFVVDNSSPDVQVGLRASRRFIGPISAPGGDYVFEAGESDPGLAVWNFDWHLDFGHSIAGTGNRMGDFIVTLGYDLDPTVGVSSGNTLDLNAALVAGGLDPADTILFQSSQNLGFNFLSGGTFDPFATGEYAFFVSVVDPADNSVVSRADMTVTVIPTPGAALLAVVGLIAVGRAKRYVA